MTSLLSTGKKKAKASRVFGGEVFNETETSLWYSPSPRKARSCSNEALAADPVPVTLFAQDDLEKNKPASIEDYRKENIPNNDHLDSNDLHKNISFQSIRNAEMNRLRAAKSPLRRSLAEKTEAAIQNATASVKQTLKSSSSINQSLNACQDAKQAAVRQRTKHTKSVRFQWDEQNATSKTFYNKVEENRRQLLAVQRKLASAHFQQKARKQETERLQRIAALDRELEFNSEVFRDHQKKLQDERDQKRKISMDTRAKLRVNKRAGEEKLEIMRREEESAILEVRSDLHRARIEGGKASAEERRKSFNFRAGDAKRIRDIRSTWKHDENVQLHNSFELSRAAAKDVEAYKKQISLERRQSLQNRNCDARRRRNKERDNTYAAMRAEHESYELKWVGEKDAEEYQKRMREERRKSLASRNKESFRHAKVMQELRALTFEKETESFLLKVAAENDAKAYLQKLADERRESLKIRGKEARRQRMYEEEQVRQAVVDALKEEILQSECQKDVENYKKGIADRTRKSLQFRAKEARVKRMEEENQRRKQQSQDHQSFELETLARVDVEKYLKDCKKRRRQSLAFRAKEKRRHAEWKRRQQEQEIEAQQKSGHLQSLDYQYMELAQQQERARIALDTLRSAGCQIQGNPFGDLLRDL